MKFVYVEDGGKTQCAGPTEDLGKLLSAAIAQISFFRKTDPIEFMKEISTNAVDMYKELQQNEMRKV